MKISAFVSLSLLCIDVGEYDKLGKTVLLEQAMLGTLTRKGKWH